MPFFHWQGTGERSSLTPEDTGETVGSDAQDLVDSLIRVLSPTAVGRSQARDLEIMHRTIASVREAASEGIMTTDETYAVMRFVVTKFVERRLSAILTNVFDLESSHKCTFHGVVGKVEHGREEITVR